MLYRLGELITVGARTLLRTFIYFNAGEDMENNIEENNKLLLWSWQTRGFSLTEGKVDHSLSKFNRTHNGYRKSCKELVERLGTDQFIWCYTQEEKPWDNRVKWELEVPKNRVRLICSITWHWILNRNADESRGCVIPEKFFNLSHQVNPCFSRAEFQNRFHDGWRNKTTEELWDSLFVDKVQGSCTHALLRYPVKEECVKIWQSA
jgi:hypothetical protein